MQAAVEQLVGLGPLRTSKDIDPAWIESFETAVGQVVRPISDEEARALARLFGPDDCYGLAWSLLHLIESARGWPLEDVLQMPSNEWIQRLRRGVENRRNQET